MGLGLHHQLDPPLDPRKIGRPSAIWTWQWKDLMSDDLVIKVAGPYLGGGNSNIFSFHPYFGKDSHFD